MKYTVQQLEEMKARGELKEATLESMKGKRGVRVTVIDQVAFEGDEAASTRSAFAYSVTSDEQPYQRIVKQDDQWRPLDLGWVKDACSMVVVENLVKQADLQGIEIDKAGHLEMAHLNFDDSRFFLLQRIPPGTDCRLWPVKNNPLYVRVVGGFGKYKVTAYPE